MAKDIRHPARKVGWEVALVGVQSRLQSEQFSYGADCMTMICDVALAITGVDPMAAYRGSYKDKRSATATLKKAGYRSISAALAGNFVECAPSAARRGDCGFIERDGEEMAVLVLGVMVWGRSPPKKQSGANNVAGHFVPREALVKTYRIG